MTVKNTKKAAGKAAGTDVVADKIQKALAEIRPQLRMDGGDVEFVSFDSKSGILKVKLTNDQYFENDCISIYY